MSSGCGNFGASPKPPNCASKSRCSAVRARLERRARERDSPLAGGGASSPKTSISASFWRATRRGARGSTRRRARAGRERRHAVARLGREVGAAEERPLVVGREEHRQRPAAAALRQHLVRELVDLVEVGPLLAIDLDVDEQLVHQRRGRLRPRRTRAPSRGTSGRPNSRSTAGSACPRSRARSSASAPQGYQSTGLRGVLQQVGAGFVGEAVRASVGMWSMHGATRLLG